MLYGQVADHSKLRPQRGEVEFERIALMNDQALRGE